MAPESEDKATTSTALVLSPPSPVTPVQDTDARDLVPIEAAEKTKLESMAEKYAGELVSVEPSSPEFSKKVDAVHSMGSREIRDSASMSNRMLERPMRAMSTGLFDQKSSVGKGLIDLRKTIDDLDPSRQNLFSPRKLLGIIPFGNKIRDYFLKFQSAQTHLDHILQALFRGQDELRQDNGAVEQEKTNLRSIMLRLREYSYLASKLDASLVSKITEIEGADPERAKALKEDVLFYVRQKHQDLMTQLAVSAQGYLALELIRKNNQELIKGVDRATTTTVSALRTAVMAAQALANQKLVLDQITALNTTTGNMIESTSQMLRDQSGRVHEQASSSTIEVEKLKNAFVNIYATFDAIDTYKLQALDSFRQTIDALTSEVQKAQKYLERTDGTAAAERAAGDLVLPSTLG
jgi:uncharacterized protein YaaN involved in tellurite resistance